MKPPRRLLAAFFVLAANAALADPPARQDHAKLREAVEEYLRTQTAGLPGQVNLTVGQLDPRLNLAACAAPEPFMPGGSRLWGKTTVGVRCSAPSAWTVYVPATVQVLAEYVVTAAPLAQGQTISPSDLAKVRGDLTMLPHGIITDPAQAIGRAMSASLPLGSPLRADSLRSQQAVQQGQMVRLISNGPGFRVSAEARALNNANDGQVTQARTSSGQVITGIARLGGVVEVTY
jgi:flagella basal body P-ring formation protein FlgA